MKRFLVLVVAVLLAACGQKTGSEYVGKWQSVKYSQFSVVIEPNGDNFIANVTTPIRGTEGPVSTSKVPATLKDGQLQISTAFGPNFITHVKASDTLLFPGAGGPYEMKRVK
jgi:hypothetical protein